MLKLNIYSIYDVKADAYITPFFQPNDAVALRIFTDLCNDKEHPFGLHPADYTLFNIGTFEIQNATINPIEAKLPLAQGHEVVTNPDLDKISEAEPYLGE